MQDNNPTPAADTVDYGASEDGRTDAFAAVLMILIVVSSVVYWLTNQ